MTTEQKTTTTTTNPAPLGVWLPIATAIIAAGISWGVATSKITALEVKVTAQTVKIEQYDASLTEIKVQLATINTNLLYMSKDIAAMRIALDQHMAQKP